LVGVYSLSSIFSKVKLAQFFLEFDFYHISAAIPEGSGTVQIPAIWLRD